MRIFDFGLQGAADEWISVNDVVMGGVSAGRLEGTRDGTVVFSGTVSLANNGGFASVRSRPQERDLQRFAGLALDVRGDGKRYKLNLKTDGSLDGVLHRAVFESGDAGWKTVRLRFDDFEPTFRGRPARDAEPLDRTRIVSFGLMISDKQAGPFRLELARIDAFED